jgi:hypothetical protein
MASKGNASMTESGYAQTGTVTKVTPFQQMLRAMANDAKEDEGNYTGEDVNAILDSSTEAEMWDADERPPLNFQHLAGCEIGIIDFTVKYSRGGNDDITTPFVYDGKKMYILATCVRLSNTGKYSGEKSVINLPKVGEVFQANTSARFVVAKIWKANIMGMINASTGKALECVVQETDLGGGQAVIKLRPMPDRTIRATAE